MSNKHLTLPTLKSRMGDWIYYVSVMTFKDLSERLSMADEIHTSKGLKTLIQREVQSRTENIVNYLKNQEQRFFNAIVVGIYEGEPTYRELDVRYDDLEEDKLNYLSRTFGILTLSGSEKLFAIDGQHRTKAIKDAILKDQTLEDEEVAVIFLPHKNTEEGLIRTRRVFSTLNRYAKPVSKSEIIAIDEEDNCAIITRNLVEDFDLLEGIVAFNKTRSISKSNKTAFTNIVVLYDFVTAILTNQNVFGTKVSGEDYKTFTHRRSSEDKIEEKEYIVRHLLATLFEEIPSLKSFLQKKEVDRKNKSTSLLFRPIGQNILYSTLKVGMDKNRIEDVINFFSNNDFSLEIPVWKDIFLDKETDRIKTDKALQRYAFQLILIHLGIKVSLTDKDKEIFDRFEIKPSNLSSPN